MQKIALKVMEIVSKNQKQTGNNSIEKVAKYIKIIYKRKTMLLMNMRMIKMLRSVSNWENANENNNKIKLHNQQSDKNYSITVEKQEPP